MKTMSYNVIYHYYQYNSGAGDNGYGTASLGYTTFEEAKKWYNKINLSIEKRKNDDERYKNNDYSEQENPVWTEDQDYELINDLLPYSGYFVSVKIMKIYREKFLLDENGNEVPGQ